jgi:hypothetical protein
LSEISFETGRTKDDVEGKNDGTGNETVKTSYQGQMHSAEDMMGRYWASLEPRKRAKEKQSTC